MRQSALLKWLTLHLLIIAILASESRYIQPSTQDEERLTEVLREIKELEDDRHGSRNVNPEIRQEIRDAVKLLREELEKQNTHRIDNSVNSNAQTSKNTKDSNNTRQSLTESPNLVAPSGASQKSLHGAGDSIPSNNCDNGDCTAQPDHEPVVRLAAPEAQPVVRLVDSQQNDDAIAFEVVNPDEENDMSSGLFFAIVAGCSVAGLIGLVVAGVCWYKLQKNVKAASEVEYPAYGHTGGGDQKEGGVSSPGDRKLAQSAQMYHYQHQKQQMIAMEKANGEMKDAGSEDDTEDENEEGDYTVYECPGLAPTGEMEVKNPLFNDDTPVTSAPPDDATSEAPQ